MQEKYVPTTVYARVVGYYRPVDNWNDGKKQEWKERSLCKAQEFTSFMKSISTSQVVSQAV